MKIAVGLSGGVDSSVAAWLLKQQGHEIIGIMMRIWDGDESASVGRHACYGPGEEEEEKLAETLFPLGELTKTEVRKIATEQNFPTATVPEGQDFYCGDYAELLDFPSCPGKIIDKNGKVLGHHDGIWKYTPGQRKGLGISGAANPLYVVDTDNENNIVRVGAKEETLSSTLTVTDINWLAPEKLTTPLRLAIKIRSSAKEADGTVESLPDNRATVSFDRPQSAAAPGQSAVFYRGDIVVGGGIIDSVTWPKRCSAT